MRVTLGISLLLSALPLAHGQGHPPKLAAVARFDLIASTSVEAIQHGQILSGDGTVDRMSWIPGTDQPRSYTVEFAAPHFLWSEAVFQFTPAADGVVELRLLGPWEPSPGDGSIYRQELFWDALTVSNTSLSNGSFEQVNGALPLHWTRPYGDASTASNAIPAKDGLRYARTWHDGPLTASLAVPGGLPITLRFHARAVLPANHVEMARLSDTNSPAHRAAESHPWHCSL